MKTLQDSGASIGLYNSDNSDNTDTTDTFNSNTDTDTSTGIGLQLCIEAISKIIFGKFRSNEKFVAYAKVGTC